MANNNGKNGRNNGNGAAREARKRNLMREYEAESKKRKPTILGSIGAGAEQAVRGLVRVVGRGGKAQEAGRQITEAKAREREEIKRQTNGNGRNGGNNR